MKLWVILYQSKFNKEWTCDSITESHETAQAKLAYERLKHSDWRHELVEVEVEA